MRSIYIQPFGKVDFAILSHLAARLEGKFSLGCEIGSAAELPGRAHDSHRNQYVSTFFLDEIKSLLPREATRGLGVVEVDLFVPGLNFVFGEAELTGDSAVISLCRLYPEFFGLEADQRLLNQRTLKEAVHELGHTFGLRHCKDPHCVMHFSNSIADTDIKREDFCVDCSDLLGKVLS